MQQIQIKVIILRTFSLSNIFLEATALFKAFVLLYGIG